MLVHQILLPVFVHYQDGKLAIGCDPSFQLKAICGIDGHGMLPTAELTQEILLEVNFVARGVISFFAQCV